MPGTISFLKAKRQARLLRAVDHRVKPNVMKIAAKRMMKES